jgi:hypothetical protein
MIISNEHVREVTLEVPDGHKHLRATITFTYGSEITFQEATIANLVRAYITIKTHPVKNKVTLRGEKIFQRKDGYAEW